jgi:hypothetical protein
MTDIPLPKPDPARRPYRRRRWLAMATALVGLVGAGMVVTRSADAANGIVDGFEGNAYDRWTTVEVRGQSLALLEHRSSFPRTGSIAAWLYGGQTAGASARIHRHVSIERPSTPIHCYGMLWMRKHDASPQPTNPVVTVRVLDGAAGAPAIWTKVFTVSDKNNWQSFQFSGFPFRMFYTVDISVTGEVLIDDLSTGCVKDIQ